MQVSQMSKPKISVILPIYNVEDYLEDTLNCLLDQTLEDIEVLMIDDGSTDNSRYIIEKYALDHDNFHAFHKENGGPALARDFGLDQAKGDYVHFLDADDKITHDGYEKLYDIAVNTGSDIVTAPVIRFRRYNIFDGKFYKKSLKKFDHNIYSTTFNDYPELIWDLFLTNKLYRLDFLKENKLRHVVGNNAYCDDGPFSLKAYIAAQNVSISTDIFYYWRVREKGSPSITQKLSDIETFYDRLQAIELTLDIVENNEIDESLLKEFYLKLFNHDLYLHYSKFHLYDEKYHLELIERGKSILNRIPNEYKQYLNSINKIIYQMVEEGDIQGLVEFSSLDLQLKENPHIPESLDEKYVEYIDFSHDIIDEELAVKKEEIRVEDNNLIIRFKKRLNYLTDDTAHDTIVKLIDSENNEVILNENDCEIHIPIDSIKDKKHMKIKFECISDSFKKECYLTNNKREVFELDGFDIEIGIGINNVFLIDIQPTDDLILEIDNVIFEDNLFKFSGISNKEISEVYIQNVVSFDKISYDVISAKQDNDYKIDFVIPYEDILSHPVRKWELRVSGAFKLIKSNRKFEFYNEHNFVYMINIRNKILISDDIYNSRDKLNDYLNITHDLKISNRDLRKLNRQLKKENKKLNQNNKKLEKKNLKLDEKNKMLENKVINVNPIKNKLFKK